MSSCSHCHQSLTPAQTQQSSLCPHCGQPWDAPFKPGTIANFPNQTLDFGTEPPGTSTTTSTVTAPSPAKSGTSPGFPDHTIDISASDTTPEADLPSSPTPVAPVNTAPIKAGPVKAGPVKTGTVANFPDHTIDLSVPSMPTPPGGGDGSQTLQHDSALFGSQGAQSVKISVDQPPGKPATLPDRGQMTMDVPASGSNFEKRIDELWDKEKTPSSPYVTMRSQSQSAGEMPASSTLVIRERALAGMSDRHLHVADYDLLEVLGEGGMGVVYTARQASVDREVALKMLKPEMLDNSNQRRKFLSEAVVTGELDHPNIVPIYDVGQNADGTLFYSMKKVQGTPWSKIIREKTVIENVDILLKVADAVAFAHARGVIHRDLKPENAMLGEFGEVLVLDWGLAVATEGHRPTPNVATDFGIAGTPAYMSPELAMGPLDQIGKHSDVYLLGAILFEIIAGFPPHQGRHAMECLKAAARNEIAPTDKRGELFDIALRAMRTNPAERYQSVQAFQEAIRQYQSHSQSIGMSERAEQDLQAATGTEDYRLYARALLAFEEAYSLWDGNETAKAGISCTKVCYAGCAHRKHDYDLGLSLLEEHDPDHAQMRTILVAAKKERDARQGRLKAARRMMIGLVAAVFLAVTVGIVLTTLMKFEADKQRVIAEGQKIEADKQRDSAKEQKTEADKQRDLATVARSQAEYEAYGALISTAAAKIDENAFSQAADALAACQKDLRGWEWDRLNYVLHQGAGRQLATPARVEALASDASGQRLLIGQRDGTVRLWDMNANSPGKVVQTFTEPGASVLAVAFSPSDANLVAIGTNVPGQQLQLLNLATGKVQSLAGEGGHSEAVVHLTFSRDGQRLLSASHDHTAKLWDIASAKPLVTYKGHSWLVWSAIFSPDQDERFVATASEDGTVRLWETATGKQWTSPRGEPIPFTGHRGPVYSIAFLPQSEMSAAPSAGDNALPDVGYLASAGYDKRILMWRPQQLVAFDYKKLLADEAVPETPAIEFAGHTAAVRAIAFSPDGSRLLSASSDNSLRLWYAQDRDLGYATVRRGSLEKELRGHDGPVQTALFLPGKAGEIASGGFDKSVRLWNAQKYSEERPLPALALRGHVDAVMAGSFSRDGQSVFTASRDRTAKKWSASGAQQELLTFREGHAYLTSRVAFYPQGDRLLTAAVDGTVRVWNVQSGAELFKIEGTGYRSTTALSPDGKWILTGSDQPLLVSETGSPTSRREGAILWDAATGERVRALAGHKVPITAVAFSHDGQWAFTGDEHGVAYLWDTKAGTQLARLEFHQGPITAALFTKDGQRLLTASTDRSVCQWDLSDAKSAKPLPALAMKHSAAVNAIALTPDGKQLLTGCDDGTARLWDWPAAKELWTTSTAKAGDEKDSAASINSVAISPQAADSVALLVDTANQIVSLVDLATGREILSPVVDGPAGHFLDLKSRDALGWSAAFSPDGKQVVTVGGDEARLWDRQGVEVASFGPHRPLTFVSVSPDDKLVVTAGWDNSARVWDALTAAPLLTLSDHTAGELGGHSRVVNSAEFSPDGTQILTASDDGTIRLWGAKSGQVLKVFRGSHGGITRAKFLRSGQSFVAAFRGSESGATAGIWEIGALGKAEDLGSPKVELRGHSQAILDLALSDNERYIITGSADNSARIWDAATGKELQLLEGHSGEVSAVAFAQTGPQQRVLTGSADRTAKLWDVSAILESSAEPSPARAKELLTLRGHTRGVTSVGFSPSGSTALTTSRDGLAILWPAEDSAPVAAEQKAN